MKVNPLNQQQQNQKNIQREDIKEIDIKNISNQQTKIKLHNDEDKLEMLGDGNKKEIFESLQEYTIKKEELYRINMSSSFIDRHYLIMNNIKSIMSDSASDSISFEDRLDNQITIDGYTKDLKSLASNIEKKLDTDEFDPKNMELQGVMSLAKMGKVTVKSRKGRNERIVIYYTGDQNKTVNIDLDKNTGEICILAGKKADETTNKMLQEIFKDSGLEVSVENRDLNKKFFAELDRPKNSQVDILEKKLTQNEITRELIKPANNTYKSEKKTFDFKKMEDIVGLSVMTKEDAQDSITKMDNALGLVENSKKKLIEKRDTLEVDLGKFVMNVFGEKNIKNIDEAKVKLKNIQENLLKDRNYEKYLERIKDPALVYKLLK